MANLSRWVKPNGVEVSINDENATIEYAIEMGWEPYNETEAGIAEAEKTVAKAKAKAKEKMKDAA